jgi:alkanesulfonate monooxygenase SsuD/methylene tetrahydromethanopterin reductase-like flavin-dependent oxidoreductase (luciferase family)
MTSLNLRYDLRCANADVDARAEMYSTALDQIEWADRVGFASVLLHEHHGTSDGYLPSPIVMAAAVAARTTSIRILVSALVVPLYDPLRLAEDLAVVDLISRGRLILVAGTGYVPHEFAMFGRQKSKRGVDLERGINVLRQAWTGEPFEYEGRTVSITPRPYQRPNPPLLIGGGSSAAAKRAAQMGDGFAPHLPEAWEHYRQELSERGRPDPGPRAPSAARFLYVAEDPELAWSELWPYLMHDLNSYAEFASQADEETGFERVDDLDGLRRSPHYQIVTPKQCLELAGQMGPHGSITFHPMAGGMPPKLSWAGLRRFEQDVLPLL